MLMYSSSPASAFFNDGQSTVNTVDDPFYSLALAIAITENKEVLSFFFKIEIGVAPFYSSSIAFYGDGSNSKHASYIAVSS